LIVLISAVSTESPIEPADEDNTRRQSSQEGAVKNNNYLTFGYSSLINYR
jgi:hypothetical protein